jgi:hypothetical protein
VKRSYYWLLLLPCLPLVILALFLFPANKPIIASDYFERNDQPLLKPDADGVGYWSSFRTSSKNIQWPPTEQLTALTGQGKYILTERIDPVYWVAGLIEGNGSGKLETVPFRAPRWISLTVTGDLTRPGNEVYFQLDGTNQRLPVQARTEEFYWRRVTITLPSDWVGKQIRLIARAGPRKVDNWFGFSCPRSLGNADVLALQLGTVSFLPQFLVALAVFLLPGLPLAVYWIRGGTIDPAFLLPLAIIFASLAGYLAFWVYLLDATAGRGFGAVLMVGSVLWLLFQSWRKPDVRALLLSEQIWTPLKLMTLVGLFYVALLYSIDLETAPEAQSSMRFFEYTLAVDNDIPFYFANPLYTGEDVREQFPIHVPGWHGSDRPPLQTGLLLLQLPLGYLLNDPWMYSLLVGCALQCVWVPAVWLLWTLGGLPRRRAGLAFLFVVLSGFALVNTIFCWPKMLSAGLCLFAVALGLLDRSRGQAFPRSKAFLLGLSAVLASLGHGGVAFTLLPFGLLLLFPRWYPGLGRLALAGVVYIGMYYPWTLYQKLYDPPGTKLLKLHLAGNGQEGDNELWQDDRPLWKNLVAAYQAAGMRKALINRLANLKMLFVAAPDQYPWPPHETPAKLPDSWTGFRRCDFLALFWSLGLLNLGWLVPRVKAWQARPPLNPVLGVTLLRVALASVLVWVVLMFGPGSTVVHQGSYATFLLFFVCLAARVSSLPGRWPYLLLAVHGALFLMGWLLTSPANDFGVPNFFMISLAVIFLALLVSVALGAAARDPLPARKQGASA